MTVRDLREQARLYSIKGRWKMRKAELQAAVDKAAGNAAFLGVQSDLCDFLPGGRYAQLSP